MIQGSGLYVHTCPALGRARWLDRAYYQGIQGRFGIRPDRVGRQHVLTLLGAEKSVAARASRLEPAQFVTQLAAGAGARFARAV
jgi:hypothetical protein